MTKDSGRETCNSSGGALPAAVLPVRLAALAVVLISLAPVPLRAQWERLPLYAGHADRLVQNKYLPNQIFAVVRYGGIYMSQDYGETWRTVVTDIVSLGWDEILDFDVSESGQHYVLILGHGIPNASKWRLWRSTNEGMNWFPDKELSKTFPSNYSGCIETHRDGTILLACDGNSQILRSRDDFLHTDTIATGGKFSGVGAAYFHPDSSGILFREAWMGMNNCLLRSSDDGKTWTNRDFPHGGTIQALKISEVERRRKLGLWQKFPNMQTPSGVMCQYDYYESTDDGVTWSNADRASILTTAQVWDYHFEAWYDVQGVSLMSAIHTVYRSTDGNRTLDTLHRVSIWDFLPVRDYMLAATNFDGLQVSTDLGLTWQANPGSRAFAGFSEIEFAASSEDTLFAILRDVDHFPFISRYSTGLNEAIFQSMDGGRDWHLVVRDTSVSNLRASSRPAATCYAVRNASMLIRCTAATGEMDTLFTSTGRIAQFEISDVFPDDMYIVEQRYEYPNPFIAYCSTDAGRTWMRFFQAPPFAEDARVHPSRTERGKAFVSCRSLEDMWQQFMGIYAVREYGKSNAFTHRNWDYMNLILFGDDVLFRGTDRQFSSDEGRTWSRIQDGLSPSDLVLLDSVHNLQMTTSGDRLYLACGAKWFKFMNGSWRTMRDASGSHLSHTPPIAYMIGEHYMPNALAEVGSYMYCGNPFDGLYRIRIQDPTDVEEHENVTHSFSIQAYPNPFQESIVIRIEWGKEEHDDASLIVRNMLGQTVYHRKVSGGGEYIKWNGLDGHGNPLSAGVYDASIVQKGIMRSHILLIHSR